MSQQPAATAGTAQVECLGTFENPNAITDVAELRAALSRANARLMEQQLLLSSCTAVLQSLAQEMSIIVSVYLRGDAAALHQAMATFMERRVKVAQAAPGMVQ